MDRYDFQNLARIRTREARALIKQKHYNGAYYLLGYSIECGLKACIAKKTKKYEFPDKKAVIKSYTHKLQELIEAAGLSSKLALEIQNDKVFGVNWATIKDWSEESRYEVHDDKKTKDMYLAVSDRKHGVLKWIRQYW